MRVKETGLKNNSNGLLFIPLVGMDGSKQIIPIMRLAVIFITCRR